MPTTLNTNTSQWSMVILGVTPSSARIWVGTLFPTLKMPNEARVEITDHAGNRQSKTIGKADWRRPFRKLNQRFYTIMEFNGLKPGTRYEVDFSRYVDYIGKRSDYYWQSLKDGTFDTLPLSLSGPGEKPFTVGFGSCFYNHRDGGQAAGAYRALYERGPEHDRPDISFLTGDQVYLDIGFDSLSLIPSEIRQRIAHDYALHWQTLGSILTRGGTWMLPDDHEYWNDYPFYDSLIPTLLALKLRIVREAWSEAALDGVLRVQNTPIVESFTIGNDLSFCLVDARSYRAKKHFLEPAAFDKLLTWARSLTCPGVLVLSQPLIVNQEMERNLRSFPADYNRLIEALGSTPHDIVLLSGDVHFGRISQVRLGDHGGRLIEVISSPLSNLTGLNGIATAAPEFRPKIFPESAGFSTWQPQPVTYNKDFAVSTRPGWPDSDYPRVRTVEHFMTAGFRKDHVGQVEMVVNAWQVRNREPPNNTPVRDLKVPFQITLN